MVHEVENIPRFFSHVPSILKEQGDMLVAEPAVMRMPRTKTWPSRVAAP
jgi:hypothetical protein